LSDVGSQAEVFTPNTLSSFNQTTITNLLAEIDSPFSKFNSENQTKYFDLRDEPSWTVKNHQIPEGEMILKVFGKLLFETASLKVCFLYFSSSNTSISFFFSKIN